LPMRTTVAVLLAALAFCATAVQAQTSGYTWTIVRQTYVLAPDGRYTATIEAERKAHDAQAARDGGRIDLTYSASQQRLEIIEAMTIKADGRRVPVAADKILDLAPQVSREVALYTDLRTRSIVFPDLQAGDSIRYAYRLDMVELTWPGFFTVQFWNPTLRVVLAEHVFDHPASMHVADERHGTGYRVEKAGDRVRRVFSWTNPTRVDNEAGATSPSDWGPRYAITTLRSYGEIGDHYGRLHAVSSAVSPEVAALAAEIVGSTADRRHQARLLYDWVAHNIRYVAVAVGQGKLTPTPAAETIKSRYGDCKARVALLAALLAARGIASEPALMNANASRYTLPEVPVGGFNHVILYLPELDLYVDSTWQNASFGVLPWGHYDAPVLHAVEGKSRVARIPAEKAGDNVAEVHVEATVSASGKVRGLTRETARGVMAGDLRSYASDTSAAKAASQLRHFGSPGTGKWLTVKKDPASPTVELFGEFELSDPIDLAAGEALFPPLGLRFVVRPSSFLVGLHDAPRKHPFPCHAGRQVETIEVSLPAGLRPARLPADRNWKTSIAEYRSSYRFSEETLHVRREFVTAPEGQVCRPELSQELVGLLSDIRRDLRSVVVFDK
jgi:transglutaminase-like putative cysteine protease